MASGGTGSSGGAAEAPGEAADGGGGCGGSEQVMVPGIGVRFLAL
jgi:hypothetical protein